MKNIFCLQMTKIILLLIITYWLKKKSKSLIVGVWNRDTDKPDRRSWTIASSFFLLWFRLDILIQRYVLLWQLIMFKIFLYSIGNAWDNRRESCFVLDFKLSPVVINKMCIKNHPTNNLIFSRITKKHCTNHMNRLSEEKKRKYSRPPIRYLLQLMCPNFQNIIPTLIRSFHFTRRVLRTPLPEILSFFQP